MGPKTAIFVEGQAEREFVVAAIKQLLSADRILIKVFVMSGSNAILDHSFGRDDAFYVFTVFDCANDQRVTSEIILRADGLASKGFCRIFGLRDLYPTKISERVSVESAVNAAISKYQSLFVSIEIGVSVHEFEAWYIADVDHFRRLHCSLTDAAVASVLGKNWRSDDPELIEHPALALNKVYAESGFVYSKKLAHVQKIMNCISIEYLFCLSPPRVKAMGQLFKVLTDVAAEGL